MNLRSGGFALGALFWMLSLTSCMPAHFVSPHRGARMDESEEEAVPRWFPYRLSSNVVEVRVLGQSGRMPQNEALALFDLRAFARIIRTSASGGLDSTVGSDALISGLGRSDTVEAESRTVVTETKGTQEVVDRRGFETVARRTGAADIAATLEEQTILTTEDLARRFGQQAFERFLVESASYLRLGNRMFWNAVRLDPHIRMIFVKWRTKIGTQESFADIVRREMRVRSDLLSFEKKAFRGEEEIQEIAPGETFQYVLELRSDSPSVIPWTVFYDELPRGLVYERRFSVTLEREDGTEEDLFGGKEEAGFVPLASRDEWTEGIVAWALVADIRQGDRVRLSFDVTPFRVAGETELWGHVAEDGVRLYSKPLATDDYVSLKLTQDDLIFVLGDSEENAEFYRVFVRRPISHKDANNREIHEFERYDGMYLPKAQYRQSHGSIPTGDGVEEDGNPGTTPSQETPSQETPTEDNDGDEGSLEESDF